MCEMEGRTEKPLDYQVKMLPDMNPVNRYEVSN